MNKGTRGGVAVNYQNPNSLPLLLLILLFIFVLVSKQDFFICYFLLLCVSVPHAFIEHFSANRTQDCKISLL